MGKSILMVLTSVDKFPDGSATGWYLPEAAHPYYKFVEAGHSVTFASISGTSNCDPSSIEATKEDGECVKFLGDAALVQATTKQAKLADVDVSKYDVIFFVGGFGTMWDFPDSPEVQKAIETTWKASKIVACVCHAPCALMNVKIDGKYLVEGKELTGFTNEEEVAVGKLETVSKPTGPGSNEDVLTARGATFKDGGAWAANVVQSGNLFTGQNPPSAGPLAVAINKAIA